MILVSLSKNGKFSQDFDLTRMLMQIFLTFLKALSEGKKLFANTIVHHFDFKRYFFWTLTLQDYLLFTYVALML